jgi:diadenosine tetraphosphate (Ap4A) HIT family hydrolase
MLRALLPLTFAFSAAAQIDLSRCDCDPANPTSLDKRECSLSREAALEAARIPVVFRKDINPRKPNRWVAMPRTPRVVFLSDMTREDRDVFWSGAIAKARELFGENWGVAYNGERTRTQCHVHVHLGRLLPGVESGPFLVVDSPAEIPVPASGGLWVHAAGSRYHVHTGEQITETVLLR